MSLAAGGRRALGATWLLCTQTFVLVLITLWTVALGLAHGVVLFAVIPATLVGLSGWLTAAWRRERPWAWRVATILFGMRFGENGLVLLAGDVSWLSAAQLVFDGLLLAFPSHPVCRARIDPPAAPAEAPRRWGRRPGASPRSVTERHDTTGEWSCPRRRSTMIVGRMRNDEESHDDGRTGPRPERHRRRQGDHPEQPEAQGWGAPQGQPPYGQPAQGSPRTVRRPRASRRTASPPTVNPRTVRRPIRGTARRRRRRSASGPPGRWSGR